MKRNLTDFSVLRAFSFIFSYLYQVIILQYHRLRLLISSFSKAFFDIPFSDKNKKCSFRERESNYHSYSITKPKFISVPVSCHRRFQDSYLHENNYCFPENIKSTTRSSSIMIPIQNSRY